MLKQGFYGFPNRREDKSAYTHGDRPILRQAPVLLKNPDIPDPRAAPERVFDSRDLEALFGLSAFDVFQGFSTLSKKSLDFSLLLDNSVSEGFIGFPPVVVGHTPLNVPMLEFELLDHQPFAER